MRRGVVFFVVIGFDGTDQIIVITGKLLAFFISQAEAWARGILSFFYRL